jgi:hypothetical protein
VHSVHLSTHLIVLDCTCSFGAIQESGRGYLKEKQQNAEKAGYQQVSEMWTRPVLCRICECPVSDGGVRVDQLDAAKLSKWWLCKIGTDFQPAEAAEESEIEEIICNFCIWDAR